MDEHGSIVVLSDAPTEAAPGVGSPLPFVDHPTEAGARAYVTRVRLSHEARPLAVALRDFDFRNPALQLDGRARDAGDVTPLLEHFHFAPGAFRVVDVDASTFTPIADLLGATRHQPPANATKAVWRSRSTPDADGYNEISFEDRAGAERFYERAERDKATEVLRDESLSVGGKRCHEVSGDEDRAIGGTVRERIGGALHETVKGERRDSIGADHSVVVGGDRQEEIGGRWAIATDGAIHLFSDSAIVIEAPDITLKSGGAFLRIGAGGVTTGAGYPEIHSGAPGSGEGSAPAAPELPGKGGVEAVAFRPRVRLPLLARLRLILAMGTKVPL